MRVVNKEKQIKEVEVVLESYDLCDKCDERIHTSNYDAFECNFTHITGDSFPEGGSGIKESVDLCQKCAKEAFKLLKENGYRVIESDYDY